MSKAAASGSVGGGGGGDSGTLLRLLSRLAAVVEVAEEAGGLLAFPQVQGIIFSVHREQTGVRLSQRRLATTQPLQFFWRDLAIGLAGEGSSIVSHCIQTVC